MISNGPGDAISCFNSTVLHISAQYGHLPSDTTLQILDGQVDDLERTALDIAVETGHLPINIDAKTLAGFETSSGETGLHKCSYAGKYPRGITVQHLRDAEGIGNWTALHASARCVNLLPETTVRDLLGPKATVQPTDAPPFLEIPLEALLFALKEELTDPPSPEYARTVRQMLLASAKLAELNVESAQQLKEAGVVFSKYCPVDAALFVSREMIKLRDYKLRMPKQNHRRV
jgi:hypothetical protein